LLIWRTDNYRREKVVKDAYELVSKIKAHAQTLHMISISPDENYFMTGSVDGTANIWKQPETAAEINELIEDIENGRKEGSSRKEHPFKRNLVKALDASSEISISQCDSIEWSCRGRYAVVAFGGKEDEDSILDRSIIYVWDQRNQ
jgi:WD40 repeat protein